MKITGSGHVLQIKNIGENLQDLPVVAYVKKIKISKNLNQVESVTYRQDSKRKFGLRLKNFSPKNINFRTRFFRHTHNHENHENLWYGIWYGIWIYGIPDPVPVQKIKKLQPICEKMAKKVGQKVFFRQIFEFF